MIPTYKLKKYKEFDKAWFFFKENNEKKVHDAMVKSIKKGIECNLLSVISITFILENDKKYSVRIIRDKWNDLLNEAGSFYLSCEEYENCARVRDLLKQLKDQKINTTL